MSRRIRSFLFDNINGKLLTGVSFTLKEIEDEASGTETINGIQSLPSQTGSSGYYLTTNGTDASWALVSTSKNLDGGFANSIYTSVQSVNGGTA